jgi:hypothetical protein
MLRGFITTLAIVTAITMGAWAYTEQARMASATPIPSITPAASSATTNSNVAKKGDKLEVGTQMAADHRNGEITRIMEAHARVASASGEYMTIAQPSGQNETTLVRVPLAD